MSPEKMQMSINTPLTKCGGNSENNENELTTNTANMATEF